MTKQLAENADNFLHHLDVMAKRSVHHEQMQEQLFRFILYSANHAVETHCATQRDNLRVLSRVPSLNQVDRSGIEQCRSDYVAASQNAAQTLDEIDITFRGVETVNMQTKRVVSDLAAKLANEKSVAAIEAANREFENKYKAVAANTMLIIGGLLLCGLTFGLGAAEGAGLIVEGVNGFREDVGGRSAQQDDLVAPPTAKNNLLEEFDKIDNRNRELFNENWLHLVERHCCAQQASIQAMKHALPPEHQHYDSLKTLEGIYNEKIKRIDEIKAEEDSDKKHEQIRSLVDEIQHTEEIAKNCIQKIKADLPKKVKPEADGFLDRAERFYQNNKKMIDFAGLMAITAIGVALTIATGGIASVIGAAVLGAVAFKPIKSAEHRVTQYLSGCFSEKKVGKLSPEEEQKLVGELKKHAVEHCEKQITLLKNETVSAIPGFSFYHTYKEELENTKTIDGIREISLKIEKLDESKARAIQKPEIKKQFSQNAKTFKKENKEIFSVAAKVVLAGAALTVLGLATGGVGVGIALGFAAASWFVQKVIKKVRNYKSTASQEEEGKSKKPPIMH